MRLWRLARMSTAEVTGEPFTRDPAFDLQRFTRRSFGTFQEQPVDVVLRFDARVAADVAEFVLSPRADHDAARRRLDDGTLHHRRVEEMCWHLVTLGNRRHRRTARSTAPPPDRDVHPLAAHHGAVS